MTTGLKQDVALQDELTPSSNIPFGRALVVL